MRKRKITAHHSAALPNGLVAVDLNELQDTINAHNQLNHERYTAALFAFIGWGLAVIFLILYLLEVSL